MRRTWTLPLLVTLALVGCGGETVTEPEAVTTAPAPAGGETTAPPEVVPIEVPPCDLLTAAEVESATGLTVTEVRDDPPIACVFALDAGQGVHIQVSVEDGMGRFAGPANLHREYGLLVESGEAAAVPGLGEGAFCCPFRAVAVDAGGGRFIAVAVGGGFNELAAPREALIELAEAALGRL